MLYQVRQSRPEDFDSIASVYRRSILGTGTKHYSPLQLEMWASFSSDIQEFREWLSGAMTLVAVNGADECIAFGGLESRARISSLFVAPEYMRQGIASMLVKHLMDRAKSRGYEVLRTEASEFSKPVFERFGFSVIEVEYTQFKGVGFSRYAMQAHI